MSLRRSLRTVSRSVAGLNNANDIPVSKPVNSRPRKKNKAQDEPAAEPAASLEIPSTPPSKRVRRETPDPKELPSELDVNCTEHQSALPSERPAEPHRTNATLKTPSGSRLVPYSGEIIDSSPIKGGLPQPTTTTGQLLEQACAHLVAVDSRLKSLIEKHHCGIFSPEGLAEEVEPFEALCSSIMSQQVSGAAAKSIKNKFTGLFSGDSKQEDFSTSTPRPFPKPSQIVSCSIPFLRTAGLSERKAEYIKGLAEKFDCGDLSAKMLIRASDEEVLEKLVAVRGLGRWSVEMFACFGLKRMDVFSTGDLGVQ